MAVYKVLSLMISFAMLTIRMVDERNRRSKKHPLTEKRIHPNEKEHNDRKS